MNEALSRELQENIDLDVYSLMRTAKVAEKEARRFLTERDQNVPVITSSMFDYFKLTFG